VRRNKSFKVAIPLRTKSHHLKRGIEEIHVLISSDYRFLTFTSATGKQ
jgi:hypothetical protein